MSGFYSNFGELALGGGTHTYANFISGTIKAGIIADEDYTYSAADQDWNDVYTTLDTCYNSEATQTLGTKTVGSSSTGAADAADITFSGVSQDSTKDVDAVALYISSGTVTTDPLMVYLDGFSPVTPNGGDIGIQWHTSGIFTFV